MIAAATMLLLVTSVTYPLQAATEPRATTPPISEPLTAEKVTVLTNRLEEIGAMDKSTLSSTEKKALRKEVRTIKRDITAAGGTVYLSVGALLLIIILLIVLL